MASRLDGVELTLVQSVDDAAALMRWLGERRDALAFDTETTGLNHKREKVRLAQIGDMKTGWAIPWDGWHGVFFEALDKYQGPLVGHNVSFDIKMIETNWPKWKAPWHRMHDTMIASHIVDPTNSHALKSLSTKLVDRNAARGQARLDDGFAQNKWDWATVPIDFEPYWAYGALDCVLTAHIHDILRAHERYPQAYELEMAARRVCTQMEDNGIPVDLEYCERKYAELTAYVDQLKDWGKRELGFSLGSGQQLAKYFEAQGAKFTRFTDKGQPSTDKYQLEMFANEGWELARTVLAMKKADKLAGTYFKNFIQMNENGFVHPSIKTLGARTGRMSITNPALQTLNKGEATVRDAFIGSEGHKIVTCDSDQIEARLLAHFARDESLAAAFLGPDDFFVTICRQIFQDPTIDKNDRRRDLTKNVVYAQMYGAGIAKMAETAGVPESQIKGVADAFDANYPGVNRFRQAVEQVGQMREREEGRGYVFTPFGRRLPADEGRLYSLVNYMIQGHAAEILKQSIVRMDLAGLGDYLCVPVHDEVVLNVPEEDALDVLKVVEECMTYDNGDYLVPLTAGPEGPYERWGDKIRNKQKGKK